MPALRSAARMASRDGSKAGSMSPARERRVSRPRAGVGSGGIARAFGLAVMAFPPGVDFLKLPAGLGLGGLRGFGVFFDKCLAGK